MPLTYRTFEWNNADAEELVKIFKAGNTDSWTIEEILEQRNWFKLGTFFQREFAMLDGQCIGSPFCSGNPLDGKFEIGVRLLPEHRDAGHEAVILDRMMHVATDRGAKKVTAYATDGQKGSVETLEQMGFKCIQRDPMTELDLEQFDPSSFATTLRNVQDQGIVLKSIAKLDAEGFEWIHKTNELRDELMLDVPMPEPPRKMSDDELRELTKDRCWFPEGWIVAIEGDRWIGLTNMIVNTTKNEPAMIALTGVVRSHRRKGIATALKVTALEHAKKAGVKRVSSDNEENNPMLQLNLRLGFRVVYTYLVYQKELALT